MPFVRRSLIVLVAAVTALAGAFDSCLLDCHPQPPVRNAQASAHTHCHPMAAQQAGTLSTRPGAGRWQADPTCHHDHAVAAVESATRNRVESRAVSLSAPFALQPDHSVAATLSVMRSSADRLPPAVARIPLRI